MRQKIIVLTDPMELYTIIARVNREGIKAVAYQMGVSHVTLWRFLVDEGYEVNHVWSLTPKGKEVAKNA